MMIFVPVEIGLLIKAEAKVRGCSMNEVLSLHEKAFRSRLNYVREVRELGVEVPDHERLTVVWGPEDKDGESEVIEIFDEHEYVESVDAEYQRLMANHRFVRTIAKERAIKEAIAEKAQRSARPQAEAVAGAAGQGDDG